MNLRNPVRSIVSLLLLCICFLPISATAEASPIIDCETVVYREHKLVEYPMDKMDTSYSVPEGVTHINVTPFWNCHLQQLSIPSSCIEIALWASEDSSLEAISVDEHNDVYASIDGVLYDKEQTTLLLYPPARQSELFIIPSMVEVIVSEAFIHCDGIKYLLISEQVHDVEGYAFDGSSIEEIVICGNETDFSIAAFNFCPNLKKIWVHADSAAEKRLLTETDYIVLTALIFYW